MGLVHRDDPSNADEHRRADPRRDPPRHPHDRFAKQRQLLTVYVDDLLLSGPVETQHEVWNLIRSKVETEEPEPLDRYLGRTHVVTPIKT